MLRNLKLLVGAVFTMGLLAACQTTAEKLIESGAAPYTKEELTMALSNMTVVWEKGGGYYAPDGSLETLWEGDKESGTWEITDAGEVCWHVASWGEMPCEAYYNTGAGTIVIYKGKQSKPDKLQFGNTLAALASN